MPDLNTKIDELTKEKRPELIRPVAAFITFEKQEGRDRALKYFCNPKDRVEGQDENQDDNNQ